MGNTKNEDVGYEGYYALLAAILSPVKLDENGKPIEKKRKKRLKGKPKQYLLNLGHGKWIEFEDMDDITYEYEINDASDALRAIGVARNEEKSA